MCDRLARREPAVRDGVEDDDDEEEGDDDIEGDNGEMPSPELASIRRSAACHTSLASSASITVGSASPPPVLVRPLGTAASATDLLASARARHRVSRSAKAAASSGKGWRRATKGDIDAGESTTSAFRGRAMEVDRRKCYRGRR